MWCKSMGFELLQCQTFCIKIKKTRVQEKDLGEEKETEVLLGRD